MDSTPKIGAFVLETLTTGMYTNPLDSIREFIQNSTDSILKAEEMKILGKGEGRITIELDKEKKSLIIHDNGAGVPESEVNSRLIDIGMSGKNIEKEAGFRGIGRLAGIAYCTQLIFRTKADGEKNQTTVEFDCIGLKKAISPAMRQVEELANIISKNCRITKQPIGTEGHFFEVEMRGIDEKASQFLDWNELENYLGQVAPINYDAQSFKYSLLIRDWAGKQNTPIPTVNLVIKASARQERQIFKPYKNVYQTSKRAGDLDIHVQGIQFYPEDNVDECGFWIWYSKTPLLGMITDERSAGLRFRKNNIQIGGPENVAKLFAEIAGSNERFNAYYIGEIHILDKNVIPNARRDGFEDTDVFNDIKKKLKPFIKARCDEVRQASETRNMPTQKLVHKGNELALNIDGAIERGIASTNQRDKLLKEIDKYSDNARKILEKREDAKDQEKIQPVIKRLEELRVKLNDPKHYVKEKLRTDLDKRQRKIIDEIIKILENALDSENFEKAQSAIMERYGTNNSDGSNG
jgi:hypothetical protein